METDKIIHMPLVGNFERTGIRRVPKEGEYYMCETILGVGLAVKSEGWIKEIVIPVVAKR